MLLHNWLTMSPTSKIERQGIASRQEALNLLESTGIRKADPYMAYHRLYDLWCANNAALQELRPLFRMEGIGADSHIIVTNEFR
jgi:hypothetical protein